MNLIINPPPHQWDELSRRPSADIWNLLEKAKNIFDSVRQSGDEAVIRYGKEFDKVELSSLEVSEQEMKEAEALLKPELKEAIMAAMANIEKFHAAQLSGEIKVETAPGVGCSIKSMPIERVGVYVPGGSAPLFSTVLMLAVPARIAGCREIILCTPPAADGTVHPAILFAAGKTGAKVYKIGGMQAIAAMTVGTESVPRVDKIFGPGNQYVTAAKQYAAIYGMAIDMPAGPSEVAVIADGTANPRFVAADLLAQAEHGPDSQAMLLTDSRELADKTLAEVGEQLAKLPRREIAERALANSSAIVFKNIDVAIEFSNLYAPEHLIIEMDEYAEAAAKITNAGSVFLGHFAPESAGDYASGPNHTLPTNGYARAYSCLNLDSFMHKISFQEISAEGLAGLAPTIVEMAENERLEAHSNAVKIRFKDEHN